MEKTADSRKYDILKLESQLCFPLYACAKEVIRRYREPLDGLGLTYTQYIVMMVFWEYGGMTEGELGEKVRLDSGTLAPLLKRLEKQGLLKRCRNAQTRIRKALEQRLCSHHKHCRGNTFARNIGNKDAE